MTRRIIPAAILGITLASAAATAGIALAGHDVASCEQLAAVSARTTSEHAMLARYFRAKASELRKQAERDRSAASTWLSSKSPSAPALWQQQASQSRRDLMIAEEYERTAAQHDLLARKGT